MEQNIYSYNAIVLYFEPIVNVEIFNNQLIPQFIARGFVEKDKGTFTKKYYMLPIFNWTTEQKVDLINFLLSINALFSAGKEWCPSDVVGYFRDEKNLISGKFNYIYWTAPNIYTIEQR